MLFQTIRWKVIEEDTTPCYGLHAQIVAPRDRWPNDAKELSLGDCQGSQLFPIIPQLGSHLLALPAYSVPVISFLGL